MAAWPPVGSMAIAASLAVRRDLARGLRIASPGVHQAPLWMTCCGTCAAAGLLANAFSSGPPHAFMAPTARIPARRKPHGPRHDAQGEAARREGARHGARGDHAAGEGE